MECPAIKSDRDKTDFVTREFRAARRQVSPDAVRALVEAVGSDLRELASACSQLVADTEGRVEVESVLLYHSGKVEATGFRVADAAVSGRTGEALGLLRHALATGLDPVPIVAVLASSLRTLAKVAAAGRTGRSADVGKELGHGAVAGRQGPAAALRLGAGRAGSLDHGGRRGRCRGQGRRPRPGVRRGASGRDGRRAPGVG